MAFEGLNTQDRLFLVQHTKDFDIDDRLVFLSLMTKEANSELLDAHTRAESSESLRKSAEEALKTQ